MIKTIIFDLGGVYFTDGVQGALDHFTKTYDLSKEQVWNILKGDLGYSYRKGEISGNEFWRKAKEEWEVDASTEDLNSGWVNTYVPIEGTVAIVDRLRAAGFELLFLSDNVKERAEHLEKKYSFEEKFSDGVYSHILHDVKPDLLMYETALAKTSSSADQCIYIDNKEDLLIPAQKLGMKTIHFTSPERLEKDLAAFDVKF